MPRVAFLADYDYAPANRPVVIAYKSGFVGVVTTACADKAIAAGKAKRAPAARAPK